jgi:hypothetical protein
MFLQIRMNRQDQDLQRFLWRSDNSKEPEEYRLTTVTFGLTSSPFLSIQTVLTHVETQEVDFPKAVEEIKENIFVDDVLSGEATVEKAAQLATDMKTVLATGGFPLRKFVSNKPEALRSMKDEDLASHHAVLLTGEEFSTKTLGVKYLPNEDVLMFSFCDKMDNVETETRRTVLKQLHRVYDPMGMLSPFTLKAKQMFQRSWIVTGDWDDPLPEELATTWQNWKDDVQVLDEIKIKRCLVPEDFTKPKFELHAFGDACESSYGAAVYLRVEDLETSRIHTALLCSKTRVSPLSNRRSVPELELTAALITARLVKYVEKQLKMEIDSVVCWTDSMVTLEWISQPAYMWQTFVANRVAEIQKLVEPTCWRHVPGKQNPADLCSRGCSAKSLVESNVWWDGPQFLRTAETEWPKGNKLSNKTAHETAMKQRKAKVVTSVSVVNKTETDNREEFVNRFETYNKFIGVFSLIRSWVRKFRQDKSDSEESQTAWTLADRKNEEMFWVRWAQYKSLHEDIDAAKGGHSLPKGSKLIHLDPVWDAEQSVLRVGGRLHRSLLPEEPRRPIILPTRNPFVEKMVMHYHKTHGHTGVAQTLANLRSKYWLVHGKQEVRRILHTCLTCRTPALMNQKMAPLPATRVVESAPFTTVGVDFAGPLYVKEGDKNKKAYICLFTCMTTRAVHLELTHDMSAVEFLQAFERMVNGRGKCAIMYSDNAKTFKKASSVLKDLYNNQRNKRLIQEQFRRDGIEWRFITERAPWHGGFYERLVKSVKIPLRKVLNKSRLTFSEMETVLTDIEAQLNSRPLTDVSADKEDPLPLTPGHLIIGRNLQLLPDVDPYTKSLDLGKRWLYRQRLAKMFWTRWTKEYLLELNHMKKWTDIQRSAKVGDVVMLCDNNLRKMHWILGRITDVHTGRDNLVRSVTVKTATGSLRRPVQKLRLMEAFEDSDNLK